MYNTILLATDFSNEESTIQSLKKAERLSNNGRIVLMHVLDDLPSYALTELPNDFLASQIPDIEKKLEELVTKSKVKADIEVRKGSAHRSIIDTSKEIEADLILVNSHRPGLQDYLIGSTAAKIVRHASCSVLVER